ncbi:MAG: LPS assembly protein LptD [Steroidobacteraceae bacterium]|nr:LPS assembly protein LptD [Steroidobacteraceae bacterium]
MKPILPQTLLLATLAALSGQAAGQDCGPPPAPPGAEPEVTEDAEGVEPRIEITSDGAEFGRSGEGRLLGHVVVRQGSRTLTAETATFNAETRDFQVEGSVEYRDPRLLVGGDKGNWSSTAGGVFTGTRFELPERPARGTAGRLQLTPNGDLGLEDVLFTTCPAGNDDWLLLAGSIDIDREAQQGTGRDVKLEFLGVPILYLPWISFPAGPARKSGFLFPSIGTSSRSGFEFGIPYYFNLATNYDARFEPRYLSRRGLELGGEFRYLTQRSRGKLDGSFLPSDDLANRDRSYLHLDHVTDLTDRLRLTAAGENVSDDQYFEDFRSGVEGTSVTQVERHAGLQWLGEGWRVEALAQDFQVIDQRIDALDRPYARLPQVVGSARGRLGLLGLHAEIEGEAVYFDRNAGVTGARLDLAPRLSLPLGGAGWFLEPSAAWRYTGYALDGTEAGADDAPSRDAPILALDAGLVFDRLATRDGRLSQTLEPRVLYTYIPFRDQADLPVFDTGLPDLDLVQLFRSNRYVGADRLGDANQLAYGITTRLLQTDSGRQFLAATIGQKVYLQSPRVTLDDEAPERRASSDVVGELELNAYRNWSLRLATQYDTDASSTVLSRFGLQYRAARDKVVNVGYRYREGRIEQWEASAAWRFSPRWSAFGSRVYSLKDDQGIDAFLGVEYASCCWRLRLVGRRYLSNRTGEQDTSLTVQLELNGLSSVGNTDAFLERGIRGYSADPESLP